MLIRWRDSVRFDGLHPVMWLVGMRAAEIFSGFGVAAVITSANDGTHKENSKHYQGKAFDFRTKHLKSTASALNVRDRLRVALGPHFTVLLEDLAQPNEHIHVQFNGT